MYNDVCVKLAELHAQQQVEYLRELVNFLCYNTQVTCWNYSISSGTYVCKYCRITHQAIQIVNNNVLSLAHNPSCLFGELKHLADNSATEFSVINKQGFTTALTHVVFDVNDLQRNQAMTKEERNVAIAELVNKFTASLFRST